MKNTLKKGGLDVHRWTGGNIAQYYVTSIYNAKQMPCYWQNASTWGHFAKGQSFV